MGTLTHRVPNRVSSRPSSTAGVWSSNGFSYDFAIGGIPFLAGDSKERPFMRRTAQYRKDQIDQTPIPGEQSMVFWWLRSQISFHGGTGILFEEPALDPGILYSDPLSAVAIPVRFQDGEGIDPFAQPGNVTLLPATVLNQADVGNITLMGANDGTNDCYFQATLTTLRRCVEGSSSTVTWGGTGNILSMTNDGTNYYVADSTGIWKGTLTGGAGSKAWNTGSSQVVIKWAKDRLVAAIGLSLYELVGGSPPTLPAPFYTSQMAGWTWTAIEEAPDGIYVAGYSGNISKVFYVGLTTGVGNTPILAPAQEVAVMPRGEVIYSLHCALGSYLAIGTNRGIRIAEFGGNGRLSWGPEFVTVPSGGSPIYSITSYDRFIYGAYGNGMSDGTSGLVRIDLGFQTQFQHFAYCKDLRAHVSGAVRSVVQFGNSGRLVFSVDGNGSYLAQPSTGNREQSGFLTTGNIRFHTQEYKLYKFVKAEADLTYGSLAISMTALGNTTPVGSYSSTTSLAELGLPLLGPLEYASMTFTLNRDGTDPTKSPIFHSYQVKALPAQKNQRLIIVPIMLFDREADKYGNKIGYEGYARDRLEQLEALEEQRDNVMFQDLTRKPFDNRLVVIDEIVFQQTDPPTNASGTGGYALLTLRTVT